MRVRRAVVHPISVELSHISNDGSYVSGSAVEAQKVEWIIHVHLVTFVLSTFCSVQSTKVIGNNSNSLFLPKDVDTIVINSSVAELRPLRVHSFTVLYRHINHTPTRQGGRTGTFMA
jgi:hypothetical protein